MIFRTKKKSVLYRLCLAITFFILINSIKLSAQNVHHWEMVIDAADNWNYLPGSDTISGNWTDSAYNSSNWLTGAGGIGYGDNDDRTTISNTISVFMRKKFHIFTKDDVEMIALSIDYDDGFIAYLNGSEIARSTMGIPYQKVAYNKTADNCNREVTLPSGLAPPLFIIPKDTLTKYLVTGNNVLTIQVHNCSETSSDLSSTTYLSVGISSSIYKYRTLPTWFIAPNFGKYNLPLIIIDTQGQTIPQDPKLNVNIKVINNGPVIGNSITDAGNEYHGMAGFEIHGQSSQMFPKKSYSFELRDSLGLDIERKLLGMKSESDWVLYAPYTDKSLLRDALTFYIGQKLGNWHPDFKFCEVYVNGSYEGIYMLVEKIKRDNNRLNLDKLSLTANSGDSLTGGYVLKVDKTQDLSNNQYFTSYPSVSYPNARNYNYTYVYPKFDEITSSQKTYIKQFIQTFETALNGTAYTNDQTGYKKYIDIPSFIEFQIMQEFGNNVDGYRYSTFFYKERDSKGGKFYAGPLWDFNLCYGNVDYSPDNLSTTKWLYTKFGTNEAYPMHYWARLMQDPFYVQLLKLRYGQLRNNALKTDSIVSFIDSTIAYLGPAVNRNYNRWPILGQYVWPNAYVPNTYADEITYFKTWIKNRLTWMDTQWLTATNMHPQITENNITVFPNPTTGSLTIQIKDVITDNTIIQVYNQAGICAYKTVINGSQNSIILPGTLSAGIYTLKIIRNNNQITTQKIVILQ